MEQFAVFMDALGGITSLLLIVAIGFVMTKRGHISELARKFIPYLITNLSLPTLLLWTMLEYFEKDTLFPLLHSCILPIMVMGMVFCLAWLAGRYLKIDKRHLGLFCACSSNPNTIYIGVPVTIALFGPDTVHYVLLYYVASTTFFWTVGNYAISRDVSQSSSSFNPVLMLKQIVSPPIRAFIIALCLLLLDIRLPVFLMDTARQLGNLTTPLALLFIGATLAGIQLENIRLKRDVTIALLFRMVLSPILTAMLLPLFSLPLIMGKIFIIQASLPVLMQAAILSSYYGADAEYGSIMVSLSTILSAISIPVYAFLISMY